jgi:SulP family sulfate permease
MDGLLDPKRALPRVMILELSQLLNMDSTGLEALETLHAMLKKRGGRLVIAGVQEQPRGLLARSGLLAELGADNVVPTLADAWRRARAHLSAAPGG